MWRFWNCVPRFVRQQLHGPRASAGVCVEEDKGDHDVDNSVFVNDSSGQDQHDGTRDLREAEGSGCRWGPHIHHHRQRLWTRHKQSVQETADSKDEDTHQWKGDNHAPFHHQWKGGHHLPPFRPPFWRRPDVERPVLSEGGNHHHHDHHQHHNEQHQHHHDHHQLQQQQQRVSSEHQPGSGHRGTPHHCRFWQGEQRQEKDPEGHHHHYHHHHHHHEGQRDPQRGWEQGQGQGQGHFWSGVGVGAKDGGSGDNDGPSDYDPSQWWKQRYHHQRFWSQMWSQQRSLDAVTWGAGMVFGLQLSRKPQLQDFVEMWKARGDKPGQWWSLLLRVAFSKPPEGSTRMSMMPEQGPMREEDAQEERGTQWCVEKTGKEFVEKQKQKPLHVVPQAADSDDLEDKKTLSEVMQDFEAACQQYSALASSVCGLVAAEQGKAGTAVEHLQLAAQMGHAPAFFNLAMCYDMGLGVKQDLKQAATYYQRAADLGHAQSVFNLALMTLRGDGGLTKDRTRALQLLNTAAQQGLAQAQTYLGVYYTENDDNQQDFKEAAAFFQAAASQNDAEGQYFLGICYENGWGVESSDEEAARLYSSSAALGHSSAIYNLAAFTEYGLGGLQRDEEEAMSLYRKAAQLGNENAKFRLDEHEAKKAVSLWEEENKASEAKKQQSSQARLAHTRRSPTKRSSSPVFSDYVRESIAGMWSGELSAWFSSQSLTTTASSSLSRLPGQHRVATFMLGDGGDSDGSSLLHSGDADFLSQQGMGDSVGCQGCLTSLHRTNTMPELRMVSCQ